jgi:hypothetical protein
MKNNCEVRVRLPLEIKKKFTKHCEEQTIGMSVKIRQLIIKELKKKDNGK